MKTKQLIEGRLTVIKALMNDHKFDIEELKQERKQLKKQLEELPKYVIGNWYILKGGGECIINYKGDGEGYGIALSGEWRKNIFIDVQSNNWTPATDKEVQTALIKEAKKRGFKEGVKIEGRDYTVSGHFFTRTYNDVLYLFMGSEYGSNIEIMKDGKWATIIEQKKVSISGDYTKEDLEKIILTEFK